MWVWLVLYSFTISMPEHLHKDMKFLVPSLIPNRNELPLMMVVFIMCATDIHYFYIMVTSAVVVKSWKPFKDEAIFRPQIQFIRRQWSYISKL